MELLRRQEPAALGHLASFGEVEAVVNHAGDATADGGRSSAAQPERARRPARSRDYTVYLIPQSGERLQLPQFAGAAAADRRDSRVAQRGSGRAG